MPRNLRLRLMWLTPLSAGVSPRAVERPDDHLVTDLEAVDPGSERGDCAGHLVPDHLRCLTA